MASFTCRTCQIEVASVAPESGVCEDCTLREEGKTISADNPTASFHIVQTDEQASTQLYSVESGEPNRLPIPPGYVDVKFIDEGGMGQVFRALELSTGRTVAIKMLRACRMRNDMLARFSVEAKALAALKHPNLVFLYEFNERANPPYLVMEYVDGLAAYARLKANGPFKIREAVHVIHQVALGIKAAHQRKVIHRDIKPSNILIDQQGVVKLTDFGLAKRLNEKDELTIQGGIAGGTPGYMAPEQINPKLGEVDVATDVWALGATLYCLLAGQPPYPSNTNDMLDVLTKPLKPVRFHRKEVSPVLDAIVQKCLMYEPAERYPSAEALASDLDCYLNNRPTVVRPPTWAGRLWNTARNLQTPTVVAWSLALVVLCIIGASFFTKKDQSRIEEPIVIRQTEETLRQAYFAECREKLQRGETVKLIGDDGDAPPPPEHVAWPLMGYKFTKPIGNTGAAHLVAASYGYAELLDDPGIDRYVLRGEFQHDGVGINNAVKLNDKMVGIYEVGFAFGRYRLKRNSGQEIESFMTFAYQDGVRKQDQGEPKQAQFTAQGVIIDLEKKNFTPTIDFNLGRLEFQPTEVLPGLWRQLEVHISPDEILPRMGIKNKAMQSIIKPDGLPAPDRYLNRRMFDLKIDEQIPNDAYQNLAWNPRRSVGIWCRSSSVILRNVEIVPVADKSKN